MSIGKDFRFPVSVRWQGQQRVRVEAPDVARPTPCASSPLRWRCPSTWCRSCLPVVADAA
jgi:hypothetical protein